MSYAVCRMQKVKSAGLKGMQFHNQRERKSRTNDDIDHERTRENYDLKNDKNIDYNERVKEIIESQKTGTRKTRKDAVLVNELLVTSDRDFFEQLDPGEQKRFFEESYKLFSERYGKQNIAYATVHNDEQTPHMHLGVVPMRDGKLQGKNVFNRQELLWLQDKFPEHMKKQGFELKRGERGSDRKHIETAKFKKQTVEKEIDFLEKNLAVKKDEWTPRHKDLNKVILRVPDKDTPFINYNFYAQIDDNAKYWVTPTMGVYYDSGKTAFPIKLPTNVDSDGDTTVQLFYPSDTFKVWEVKDLIAITYDDGDIQKIWNAWGKPF